MSARHPIPENGSPEAQAARWLARRGAGWTAADAQAFAEWRAADPRHAAAADEAEATERLLARLSETPEASRFWQEVDALDRAGENTGKLRRFPMWSGVLAAAAAVVLLLTIGSVTLSNLSGFDRSYTTTAGFEQHVTLPDGSLVTLAPESSLNVRYTRDERRLQLLAGGADFAVAKDPDRPFFVAAGGLSVRAVGTAFRVRHEDVGGIEIVVTEGEVRVLHEDEAASGPPAFAGPGLLLAAGDSVRWDGRLAGDPLVVRSEAVPASRVALQSEIPRLVFADTTIQAAVDQLNRHSSVKIEIADPALAARTVGGGLRADSAEAFAAALATNGDIVVERPAPDRIVLRQAP